MKAAVATIHSEDNSYLSSSSGIVIDIGNGFLELIGYSRIDIADRDISEVFTKLLRLHQETFKQIKINENLDCYIFTKSLEVREVTISVLQGQDPKKIFYTVVEKPNSRLDDKLVFEEQLFKDNTVGCSIYSVPDLVLLKCNNKYLDFMDPPYNQIEKCIGLSLWESVPEYEGSNSEELFLTIIKTGKPEYYNEFKYDHYERGITYWDGSITPIYIDGKAKYIYQTCTEITQKVINRNRIKDQEELIQQQRIDIEKLRLRTMIDNLPVAIGIIDSKGEIIEVNNAFLQMWGGKAPLSKNSSEYIQYKACFADNKKPLERDDWAVYRVFATGEAVTGDILEIERFDGTRGIIINSATPIKDDEGNIINVFFIGVDITEYKHMEDILLYQKIIETQQEKMLQTEKEKNEALIKTIEMKDEFLSLISHEFKTPLTVINSAIQAMELICKNELSVKAKEFLKKIRQNSNRQLKLVNNLLDITRLNAGHLKVSKKDSDIVSLTKSITESITIFAEQKNIKLSFSSTLSKKVVGIDEEKYERILLNLLSNAVKFTPNGKSISVMVSQKIVKGKCKVCIQVIDSGVGIPADKQELVFERFGQVDSSLTRQAEGTGIGLHLVKLIVEMLNGEITLESKEGIGSTFTITLPISKVNETPIEQLLKEITDNRLIQATTIEFSDVYL